MSNRDPQGRWVGQCAMLSVWLPTLLRWCWRDALGEMLAAAIFWCREKAAGEYHFAADALTIKEDTRETAIHRSAAGVLRAGNWLRRAEVLAEAARKLKEIGA